MQTSLEQSVREAIRDIPDFPRAGIMFKDITPLLASPVLFRQVTHAMGERFAAHGVTHVVAIESRGFILGAPIAQQLEAAFVPVRKKGKLPFRTERVDYALEYGTDSLEVHADACSSDARVLVVDDVLATGGTAAATCELIERSGARVVGLSFLMELSFLGGSSRLAGREFGTLVSY